MLSRLSGGRYQLDMVLGEGGMASVWRALDTRLGRSVAIKILDPAAAAEPEELRRLAEEARTVARLVHPNIVAVFDLGAEQGVPYLVMELVNGESLRQRLAGGPLTVEQAVEIGGQICDALEAAHRAGVVHRDIKPDNILLTAADVVKICDFGIAHLQHGQQNTQRRASGPIGTVGTSGYMAPEQATAAAVDGRADLYALGCVLYAMLTGAPPFAGVDPGQVAWQQVHRAPAAVASLRPDAPSELDALVAQLLAKNPADRPATAALVRERLAEIAGTPPVPLSATRPRAQKTGPNPAQTGPAGQSTRGAHRVPPASARAAVFTRTQTMPAVDVGDQPAPSRGGIRLGPAGIAGVAVGAAAVTAVVIAAILLGQPEQRLATPAVGSASAVTAAVTPTTDPTRGTLDPVRAAVLAQVDADRLDPGKADDLIDRLNEIESYLADGSTGKAVEKIAEFRRRLTELRKDRDLATPGYRAIVDSLDQADLPNGDGELR